MAGPARPATIADVARLANVSSMTVSRVLNDVPNVSPSTRARVRRAMEQLDYRPNVLARGLVSGKSRTLGVITFDTTLYGPGAALLGIERAARRRSYGVSIETLERLDRAALAAAVDSMADRRVEGVVVIAPYVSAAGALRAASRDIPIVAVAAAMPGEAPLAAVDQLRGAQLITEHLLGLGHPTVWHVAGPPDWIESAQRVDGWRLALASAGIVPPRVVRGDWTARSGYRAARQLIRSGSPVSAVFAANDQMALGVLHAFHEHGWRVPEDVSVVGFDDIPEAEFFTPALTTVRQDFDEMGRLGLELLIRMLDSGPLDPDLVASVKPTLMVRRSSGPPHRRALAPAGG